MRVGIVGNNLYGQIFARSAEATGRVHVIAICPEFDESLEPFAAQHHLKAYPNIQTMLQTEPLDAVMLASVTAHHEKDAVACLHAGAHVLMDRPMACSLDACDRMIAAARTTHRVLMVGHVLQFWPEYVAIRDLLDRGDLGKPLVATASRVSGVLNPAWQARLLNSDYGFGSLEAHVHDIEFLIGLFGEPTDITAQGTFTEDGCCVQVHSLLRFADGCRAAAEADYHVPLNFPLSMYLRVVCEEGAVVFTFRGALAARETARRRVTLFKRGSDPVEVKVPITDAYTNMTNHFVDCIARNQEPKWGNTFQGRQSVKALLAILQSAGVDQKKSPSD